MKIDSFEISSNRTFVIAEIGNNHEGSIKLAKQLIKQAKRGGASAVKFQAYKADTLVVKSAKATANEPDYVGARA